MSVPRRSSARSWITSPLIGGIPLLAVFDRPKTVALEVDQRRPGHRMESDLRRRGARSWARASKSAGRPVPRQKGSIENLVGWVKGSFFKQRRFLDDADLRTQLAEWRTEVNTRASVPRDRASSPPCGSRRSARGSAPLKIAPAQLALRVPVVVGPTAEVLHDTHPYSMPPDAIGIAGTLFLYRDRVRIVAGRFEARPSAAVRAACQVDAARAPRATRRRRVGQARETLSAAGASARARAVGAGLSDRAHASAPAHLDA